MGEANGQIVSLAYAHPSVRSDEPEFAHAEENHRRWETAYNELKSAVLDYSNASNSIADEVAGHKLFFNFEVADFEKRVQASVKSAQGFLEQMKSELTAAQDSLNSWDEPDTRGRAEELYARLQSTAQDYTTRAQNLTGLAQEMQELSNGAARMTTLDPAWPEAKKLIERRDQIASELTQMQDRFQKDFKALHTPFTTSR
jgi:DNA repair exonuclease SbcCD ATPase subunit